MKSIKSDVDTTLKTNHHNHNNKQTVYRNKRASIEKLL
jgi:hypothetical protein